MARTRLEPAAAETVEGYVSELSRELRRRLPAQEAAQAAAETEAHLRDRVTDLVACGTDIQTAAGEAVAGFGETRAYAEALARARYETRTAAHWRLVGTVATANFLAVSVILLTLAFPAGSMIGTAVTYAMMSFWCVALLASFAGRRAQTRRYAALIGVAAVALFFAAGVRITAFVNGPRGPVFPDVFDLSGLKMGRLGLARGEWKPELASLALQRKFGESEHRLLQEGLRTYSSATSATAVPPSLRAAGEYIVPGPAASSACSVSVFHHYPFSHTPPNSCIPWGGAERAAIWQGKPYTVPTFSQARSRWLADGPAWLKARESAPTALRESIAWYRQVESGPERFNLAAATYYPPLFLWCATWVLLLPDLLLVWLGRRAYRTARAARQEWQKWRTWRASRECGQALTQ